ncbi:DUF3603 family protein [Priestia megaterium]|uniref:DUF3603 family protein n=1 Tax=Priestia megaterium TaxID=1404 RepID=UPI00287752EA|nr:DUF3603 family protein [Priestia megaterium]
MKQSYIANVDINWVMNESNGYNVPEFHEWMKEEEHTRYSSLPIVKVTKELFDHIENTLEYVPEQLLKDIENKAEYFLNYQRKIEQYAFIITTGANTLAVGTNGLKVPMKKSRLEPKQGFDVIEKSHALEVVEYEFKKKERIYSYLSLEPSALIGLIRKERHKKQVLFAALDDLRYAEVKNVEKLKYLWGEYSDAPLKKKNYTYDGLLNKLGEEMKQGWSERHDRVAKVLTKHDPYLNELYTAYDKRKAK